MDEYDSNCIKIDDVNVSWDDQQILKRKFGTSFNNNDSIYEPKHETSFETVKNEILSRRGYKFTCK